jgi:CelD/BcsL family acetyltransferase involved in cellulose biosynthesis
MLHDAVDRLELGREVELLVIERGGEWISGGFALLTADAYAVYSVGMDPAYEELRPGWLFFGEAIRRAILLKKKHFDLMRGDEAYKERLGALPLRQERWIVPGKSLLPQLRFRAYLAGSLVKTAATRLGLSKARP